MRNEAEDWVLRHLRELRRDPGVIDVTLREYIQPFYLWDRCPHIGRLREEGKSISESYAAKQSRRMETYLCTDWWVKYGNR